MISIKHSGYPFGDKKDLPGISSYSHEILMIGGCSVADFSFSSSILNAEHWAKHGIGKHIEAYSIRGNQVWEGLVNQISFSIGRRSIVVGPFLDISNKIKVGWTYPSYGIDWDTNAGKYEELDWESNTESQARYGVLEEFVSGGQGEQPDMVALRDRLLLKKADYKISETLGDGSGASVVINASCIGYTKLLEKQVYNRQWEAGLDYIDLSDKIHLILDENLFFTGKRNPIRLLQTIGINVVQEEEDNRTAWGIISDHINKGSIEDEVSCGFFPGMTFILDRGTNRTSYQRSQGGERIEDINSIDRNIPQSEINVGGMMMLSDFSDESSYIITSVRYDMSNDIASLNYAERSIKTFLSRKTMLGAF